MTIDFLLLNQFSVDLFRLLSIPVDFQTDNGQDSDWYMGHGTKSFSSSQRRSRHSMNLRVPYTRHGTAQTMAGAAAASATGHSSGRTPLVGVTSGYIGRR